ncbi:hypothetical protein [Burkholderia cenocepacia]|uniref:hypothetical protein n=1 Tax=Burkholderia cenocepacia TaxID=95486 RepID=UPI00265052A9|nr:hypothetical protein [Burkholderia cenocepacia]MDN7537060.1 hypothetical protein [Burkholderia cenocepacia]
MNLPLNALDPRARQRALDWMRETEAGDYSPADVIDDCLTCLQFLGIDVDTDRKGRPAVDYSLGERGSDFVLFSGGWRVADMDVAALLAYAPQDEALHAVAAQFTAILFQWPRASAGVGAARSGNIRGFTVEEDTGENRPDDEDLWSVIHDALKAAAAWMLARMQADYDDRLSDESCADLIDANDYRFTEAGDFVPEVTP